MKYYLAAVLAAVILLGGIWYGNSLNQGRFGTTSLLTSQSCTASTSIMTIASSASTQVLATTSRRAWARIENTNTSNSVAVAFDYDKTISTSKGNYLQLPTATANVAPTVDFGLSTDFGYTGSVQASSSVGSVSLLVTQCTY